MSDAFATVWRPGNGSQWVRRGMSSDEFKAHDMACFSQGLRITSVPCTLGANCDQPVIGATVTSDNAT